MDIFSEPYTRKEDASSLDDVRAAVRQLELTHKAQGIALSGRIIHVVHYLPIISTLTNKSGSALLSPPHTPEPRPPPSNRNPPAVPPLSTDPLWTLGPRSGHTALISGINSLSATHPQVVVGWTGDIEVGTEHHTIPTDSLSDAHKEALEQAFSEYRSNEQEECSNPVVYKPVWLKDKTAHEHYEGYCKHSESPLPPSRPLLIYLTPKALWPLFHYLLWQDVASECASDDAEWQAYVLANTAFAEAVLSVYHPGDLIWVHDYHLLLTPRLFRQLVPDAHLGLFIHTPFPSSEVFRCLPRERSCMLRTHCSN